MGEVYRATDTKLGRDVALKVLPTEMATRPERLGRFRREAKALAALDLARRCLGRMAPDVDRRFTEALQQQSGLEYSAGGPDAGRSGQCAPLAQGSVELAKANSPRSRWKT